MKQFNKEVGRRGEEEAALYLEKKGYELVVSNFSTRFGEIDMIMSDKDTLVFVEVKCKKGEGWGSPEEMFTRYKYEKVKRMALIYLNGKEVKCRIDMVGVVMDGAGKVKEIRHYENVSDRG